MIDYKSFSKQIKDKYPGEYDEYDDLTLARAIVKKYPVYADKVTWTDEPRIFKEELPTTMFTKDENGLPKTSSEFATDEGKTSKYLTSQWANEEMNAAIAKNREAVAKGDDTWYERAQREDGSIDLNTPIEPTISLPKLAGLEASKFLAPKSYEETMRTGDTGVTSTNVLEAAPQIAGALAAGGTGALLGRVAPKLTLPAIGAISTAGGLVGEEGTRAVGKLITGEEINPELSDAGIAAGQIALGAALPVVGEKVGRFLTKSASGISDEIFDLIKDSPAFKNSIYSTRKNISNAIDEKITNLLKSSTKTDLDPNLVETRAFEITDDLLKSELILPSEFQGVRNNISRLLGKTSKQTKSEQLKTIENVENRLLSIRGSQRYRDPTKYTEIPSKARAILGNAVEQEWVADPEVLASIRALQKTRPQTLKIFNDDFLGIPIPLGIPTPTGIVTGIGPQVYNASVLPGTKAAATRFVLPSLGGYSIRNVEE